MKKIILIIAFLNSLALVTNNLYSQVSITGPTCVVPGVTYTYDIQGNWDSASTMKVCLEGGVIADSTGSTTCTLTGPQLNAVTVIWNPVTSGSLALTSSIGYSTLNIVITTPLAGGTIDTTVKTQKIGSDSIPPGIICSEATGGACSPSYSYQWQQSSNIVSWNDMPGATGQNLVIDSVLTQSVYYRRKVIENTSGSIAYSDVAVVFVNVTGLETNVAINKLYCMRNENLSRNEHGVIIIKRAKI